MIVFLSEISSSDNTLYFEQLNWNGPYFCVDCTWASDSRYGIVSLCHLLYCDIVNKHHTQTRTGPRVTHIQNPLGRG